MKHILLNKIATFTPVDGNWLPLDDLIGQLSDYHLLPDDFPILFCLFERYPEDDGAEIFWVLLHLIEDCEGYETALVNSVQSNPSDMALLMVNRLINGNITTVGEIDLLELLKNISHSEKVSLVLRNRASRFVEY